MKLIHLYPQQQWHGDVQSLNSTEARRKVRTTNKFSVEQKCDNIYNMKKFELNHLFPFVMKEERVNKTYHNEHELGVCCWATFTCSCFCFCPSFPFITDKNVGGTSILVFWCCQKFFNSWNTRWRFRLNLSLSSLPQFTSTTSSSSVSH